MNTIPENVTIIPDIANAHWSGEDVPEQAIHPETGEVVGTTRYVSTDGWRGYLEVDPADGWVKIGEGTNCGPWDDAPAGTSNDEVAAEIRSLARRERREIVVVLGGSSNVFSQPYDVFVRKEETS